MDLGKHKILVIDDDQLIRHVICHALESDFQVRQAASGLEGLALAQNDPPDLVLLDVMMPGLDGYQVCQRLRAQSATVNVPIIMLTALDQLDARIRGLTVGADDYLTKPFNLDELKLRVHAHLRRSVRELSASPLTLLPGNATIEQVMRERIEAGGPLALLYVDLTNFKSYNDEYGWLKGDAVIKLLARAILSAVHTQGELTDFTGHIGGDDFVVVTTPNRAAKIAQEVIDLFDVAVLDHYAPEARTRGYIEANDRRGKRMRFPITSVAIAIVTNEQRQVEHPAQVAALAAEIKKMVKAHPGSHYTFDRRSK